MFRLRARTSERQEWGPHQAVVMVSRQSAKVEGCGRNAERKRSPKGLPDVAICKNLTSKEHSHSNIDTFCRFPIIRSDFATLPAVAI